jgi:serine/threonine-protein kinase HipA
MESRMVKDKTQNSSLNVLMNGIKVGLLEKKANGGLVFTYADSWLALSGSRPISLSMPLTNQPYIGDVVYNFFDNLLPDNTQIRARIQTRFRIPTSQPYDLLASIGKDCIGAIQIIDSESSSINGINFEPLSDTEIDETISKYKTNPVGLTVTNDDFRISLAGAQEKSAFLFHKNQWCRPLGTTPTTHIFKLPIGYLEHQQLDLSDSCENEWLCMQIIAEFGLPTAHCEIIKFNKTKVLVVERFDRKLAKDNSWIMRLPQEDMCQALNVSPNLKYQSDGGPTIIDIMKLLLGSATPDQDRDNFFRAQVLFYLLAAIDGHAKNFSLFIEAGGTYRLTPLYDVISAYPLIANKQLQKQKIKMAMALEGKNKHYHWDKIQRRHFLETAEKSRYSQDKADSIITELLNKTEEVITTITSRLPENFPEKISSPIFEGLLKAKTRLEL